MKLGITGNGKIIHMAMDSLKEKYIPVEAMWCRNEAHGRPVCEEYDIEKLYTDYDAFLKDDSFDTVYIGLPNALHFDYTKKAIEAGKHVIVEKPFTATYKEAEELVRLADENHVMIFEAILSRYSDNYEAITKYLDDIGDVKMIISNFSQYSSRYDAYKKRETAPAFNPEMAGGTLYDLNVYNVHFVTGIFGGPKFAWYCANKGFNGIDTSGVLVMDYGSFKAVCTAAKDSASPCGSVIQGDEGYILVPNRPGVIHNVTLHKNHENTDTVIDVHPEPDPFRQEFEKIQEVIDSKNDTLAMNWMNHTLQTMLVLDNARQDIDLEFPNDQKA